MKFPAGTSANMAEIAPGERPMSFATPGKKGESIAKFMTDVNVEMKATKMYEPDRLYHGRILLSSSCSDIFLAVSGESRGVEGSFFACMLPPEAGAFHLPGSLGSPAGVARVGRPLRRGTK